jgi:hypothetical protein
MGVTIHYRGKLNDKGQLAIFCDELADIAKAMGWPSVRLDDDWTRPSNAKLEHTPAGAEISGNLGLKGIQFTPGLKAEPLSFFFDRDGNLTSPINLVLITDGTLDPGQAWESIKTQFVAPETHVWIIGLLKYIKKRYISNLQVLDEGEYWETGDINILKEKMALINRKIEQISSELSSSLFGDMAGLSAEQIASIIEHLLLHDGDDS